ncbi:hypothetical protein IJM86_01310 [bacterium]|nr:hypothetical protein [bacterium]
MGKNNHNCPKVCYTENDFLNGLSKEKKSEYEKYYPLLDFDIIPKKFAKLVNGIIEEKRSKTPILRYEDIAKEWNINRKTLLEIRK